MLRIVIFPYLHIHANLIANWFNVSSAALMLLPLSDNRSLVING